MPDARIEAVVKLMMDADLDAIPIHAREKKVSKVLCAALDQFPAIRLSRGLGIDGSNRNPDDARLVPPESGPQQIVCSRLCGGSAEELG